MEQELIELNGLEVLSNFHENYPDGAFKRSILDVIYGQLKFLHLVMLDDFDYTEFSKLINNPSNSDLSYNMFLSMYQQHKLLQKDTENITED